MSEIFNQVCSEMYNDVNSLYNKEQKLKFLKVEYSDSTEKTLKSVINAWGAISKYESEKQRDILEFGIADFIDLFNQLNIRTSSSFSNRKNLIANYLQWGIRNSKYSFDEFNRFMELRFKNVIQSNRIKTKFFKSIDDLNECLDVAAVEKDNKGSIKARIIKSALFLMWCGLTIDRVYELKISDINFQKHTINVNKSCFTIDSYVEKYLQNCIIGYKDKNQLLLFNLNEDQAITLGTLHGYISDFAAALNNISKSNRYYQHLLYPKDVKESGLFFKLYQLELNTGNKIDMISDTILSKIGYDENITPSLLPKLFDRFRIWKHVFYGA